MQNRKQNLINTEKGRIIKLNVFIMILSLLFSLLQPLSVRANTSPTVPASIATLGFIPTDSVMDPTQPILYMTDNANRKLHAVNYQTKTISTLKLDLAPERLTYANGKLYVALLKSGHQYWTESPLEGAIAVVDTKTFTLTKVFTIAADPYDIVVDHDGYIYTIPGSNQWSNIDGFSPITNEKMPNYRIMRFQSLAEMHPINNRIYTVDTDSSPRDMSFFDVSNGVVQSQKDSPYHGDYTMATNFRLSPDGNYVFNGSGEIFDANLIHLSSLNMKFTDVTFDISKNKFYLGNKDAKGITAFDYGTELNRVFTKLGQISTNGYVNGLFSQYDKLIALTKNESGQYMIEVLGSDAGYDAPPQEPSDGGLPYTPPVVTAQFKTIGGGMNHSFLIKPDGTFWAWGNNTEGQLGDGSNDPKSIPTIITGLTNVVSASAGLGYTLILKNDETVWATGLNDYGQLGDGTVINKSTPAQVPNLTGVKLVAAGEDYSLALMNDGTVKAWGNNNGGQLGDGTTEHRTSPVTVSGLTEIVSIAAGQSENLALKADGTVWAWGISNNSPVQVTDLSGVIAVETGDSYSLALKSDGTVWAWGDNSLGQLANGSTLDSSSPVQVTGLNNIISIRHGVALKSDGTVWTWGSNEFGQLGIDSPDPYILNPVQVLGLSSVSSIGTGRSHILALKNDDSLWTWGNNAQGQLGNDSQNDLSSPYQALLARANGTIPDLAEGYFASGEGGFLVTPDMAIGVPWNTSNDVGVRISPDLTPKNSPYEGVKTFSGVIETGTVIMDKPTTMYTPGVVMMNLDTLFKDPYRLVDATKLAIFRVTSDGWEKIGGVIDYANHVIAATVSKFGTFTIMEDTKSFNRERLAGTTSNQTAVAVSQEGWPGGASAVVLAKDSDFPDALAGAPLAYKYNAPILLTNSKNLTQETEIEIDRLKPSTVYILGGTAAVSPEIENKLKSKNITIIRYGGYDQYDTAYEIAKAVGYKGRAVIANGNSFPDALSISSWAAFNGIPILLTASNYLPEATKNALSELEVYKTYVSGGSAVVSESVYNQLPEAERHAGFDRYETATAIAQELENDVGNLYITTGQNFPDALACSVLAARTKSAILLVEKNVPSSVSEFLREKKSDVKHLVVIGGEAVVNSAVVDSIKQSLK